MRKRKRKKQLKYLKIITVSFLIIIFVELLYVSYSFFFMKEETLYFDGINAICNNSFHYVTVGSNNDNDLNYEKAKLSIYSKKREKTFEKLYNVGYNSSFFGVAFDGEDVVAVGSYEKTKKEHDLSVRRALIVKFDKDGEILFEKDFRVLDNSRFTSIVVVDDGYFVTGQSVYQSMEIGNDSGGALLLKYNKDGELLWSKTYGSNKDAVFNDLLVVDDFLYTVGVDKDHLGIICKYDRDGHMIISSGYQYMDNIGFSDVISLGNSLYVSGAGRYSNHGTNAVIVEYDMNCGYIKEAVYRNEGVIRYNKLLSDSQNNIVAIGILSTSKTNKNKTADVLNYDGIIGKYTDDLEEVKVVTYGEERDDYFTDILLEKKDYLVVGYSSYEDGSYLSKFIRYSDALKVLEVS